MNSTTSSNDSTELSCHKSGSRNFDKWLSAGILLITVLVSSLAMSPSVADPDLWGHVQFGREVIETGEIAPTNSFSFTAEGYRWINHENLSEIVMAWTFDTFGTGGLIAGKFLLSLFVIGTILWFNFRRQVGLIPNCLLTIFVAWNLGYHWSFRPQLSSFLFFTLMVILLQQSFVHWKGHWHLKWFRPKLLTRGEQPEGISYSWMHARLLWIAPVLFVFWTNSHGGFVAGVCVFCCYLGLRSIEAVSTNWPNGRGYVVRLWLMIVVACLAVFLNPYSWRLPMWLIESLGVPRPEILDWSSDQLYSMIGAKFWGLILLVVFALALSRRSLDFTQSVLLAITLWQAVSHFRHVPFFAILAGFWIGPHLHSAFARVGAFGKSNEQQESRRAQIAIACTMIMVTGLIGYRLSDRLTQLKVDREVFPVDAFQFMSDQQLGGRLVVTYDWAQYAIAATCVESNLAPGQPASEVAFDGRFRTCYPQQIVDMHFDFLFGEGPHVQRYRSPASPPCDPTRVLRYGSPDLVLNRRHNERTETVMEGCPSEWVLLYQDSLAQLWGRRDRYDNPDSEDYINPEDRITSERRVHGYVGWPALPINREKAPEMHLSQSSR
ncbi:MAG: hypothetical protein AAF456_04970 [Planctomycetota bacterium]